MLEYIGQTNNISCYYFLRAWPTLVHIGSGGTPPGVARLPRWFLQPLNQLPRLTD